LLEEQNDMDDYVDEAIGNSNFVPDMVEFKNHLAELVKKSNADIFSNDVKLQDKELKAEKKLFKLRDVMNAEDDTLVTGEFYSKKEKLMKSDLYNAFDRMPKTVVQHIHLTASCTVDFLVDRLCYYDFVYFNQNE
jgi:hypothetical protein